MIQLDWMGSLRDLNVLSVCVRLLLAMAFGGTIGFERGIRQRAAGLRTHMLLCVGAASTMLVNPLIWLRRVTMMVPAPKKPIPLITCALSRAGSPTP